MHPFEGMFRRRFRRTQEGYVFEQWGQDVLFTPAEFDAFIRLRRRFWSNPWLWLLFLFGGILAPVLVWRHGDTATAIAVAVSIAIFVLVPLINADRKPNEAAQARVHAANGRASAAATGPWQDIIFLVWIAAQFAVAWHHHELRWFWALVALLLVWFGVSGWRLWNRRMADKD